MGRRFRFFSVFTVLFAFFYINTGFATTIIPVTYDYSCPDYKKYTSCKSGYYLSDCGTSGWTGQSISSPAFGNSCEECPSGYTCSGGTVCPKSSGVTCSPGYYLKANSSTCSTCGSNSYYCPGGTFTPSSSTDQGRNPVRNGYYSTGGTSITRTGQSQCSGAVYCTDGVKYNCPSQSTSWTRYTGTGWTSYTQCYEDLDLSSYSQYCTAGRIRRYAVSSSQWSNSVTQILNVKADEGAYITSRDANMTCELCPGGYYSEGGAVYECTPCGTESYCSAGFQNMCMDGLSTIGYGPGADEEGDCGRILHVGNNKIYLRSEKKTTPSLNVKIGNLTFYGNMSTSVDAPLKITSGNTTYSVYDDSME